MKLYQTIDGTMIGFYKERGGEVQAMMYRDVYETVMVKKSERVLTVSPPDQRLERYWIEGHWETGEYYVPEHKEYQLVVIEEHWEYKTWTEEAHWGTREYWLEPHVEIRYRFVGTSEQRAGRAGWEMVDDEWVFVGTSEQRAGRAGWESYEELIPGVWQERRIWFPEVTRTTKTWVPMHEELQLVTVPETTEVRRVWIPIREMHRWIDYGSKETWSTRTWFEPEEVWVGYEPVYEFMDENQVRLFEVVALTTAVPGIYGDEDSIVIRNRMTGEELTTTARYLGLAERIADNEFVVPW